MGFLRFTVLARFPVLLHAICFPAFSKATGSSSLPILPRVSPRFTVVAGSFALLTGYMFSRAFQRLLVYSSFSQTTSFSRSFHWCNNIFVSSFEWLVAFFPWVLICIVIISVPRNFSVAEFCFFFLTFLYRHLVPHDNKNWC